MSRPIALLGLCLLGGSLAAQVFAQEPAKWFIVRDQQTGYCRVAFLPKIASYYPHGSGGIAGGPYDSEEQALDRQKVLELQGACQQG